MATAVALANGMTPVPCPRGSLLWGGVVESIAAQLTSTRQAWFRKQLLAIKAGHGKRDAQVDAFGACDPRPDLWDAVAQLKAGSWQAEHIEELKRLEKMPLDDESRRILRDACEGLPGTFQDGGFMVQGATESAAKEAAGEVVLFNAEKGYGLIRADQQEGGDDTEVTEVFFAASGLDTEVQVGDRVCYFEDWWYRGRPHQAI
eukprot:g30927.t1